MSIVEESDDSDSEESADESMDSEESDDADSEESDTESMDF